MNACYQKFYYVHYSCQTNSLGSCDYAHIHAVFSLKFATLTLVTTLRGNRWPAILRQPVKVHAIMKSLATALPRIE